MNRQSLDNLVLVEFEDITEFDRVSEEEVDELRCAVIYCPGWIVKNDRNYLVLKNYWDSNELENRYLVIPRSCVRKIHKWEDVYEGNYGR
jgi:hypothetical protein